MCIYLFSFFFVFLAAFCKGWILCVVFAFFSIFNWSTFCIHRCCCCCGAASVASLHTATSERGARGQLSFIHYYYYESTRNENEYLLDICFAASIFIGISRDGGAHGTHICAKHKHVFSFVVPFHFVICISHRGHRENRVHRGENEQKMTKKWIKWFEISIKSEWMLGMESNWHISGLCAHFDIFYSSIVRFWHSSSKCLRWHLTSCQSWAVSKINFERVSFCIDVLCGWRQGLK